MKIEIGPMSPKISEQLKGYAAVELLEFFDHMADAISLCYVTNLLTTPEWNRAGKRLIAKIQKKLAAHKPSTPEQP